MKTSAILCTILTIYCHLLAAKPVDPTVAATVAKNYYQSIFKGSTQTDAFQLTLVYGKHSENNSQAPTLLYIFNINNSDGYVVVAADDVATPILGFSSAGSFNPENMGHSTAKWLEGYKHEIMYAINQQIPAADLITDRWTKLKKGPSLTQEENSTVGPLLKTTWGQSPHYNAQCPGGSVTGCVATAMAQVMKYWERPFRGEGYHHYFENDYGFQFVNYDLSYYYWDNMPDNVSGPNEHVAKLMYDCGVSVNMDYSPSESGAYGLGEYALETYFGYDTTLKYEKRADYPIQAWHNKLLAELDAGQPVLYRGSGSDGGHAFVCDGYMIDNFNNYFFHMNWGWNGSNDGFYYSGSISALNPGTFDFNAGQAGVFGVKPNNQSLPDLELITAINISVPDSTFVYQDNYNINAVLQNYGPTAFTGKLALALFRQIDDSFVSILDSAGVFVTASGGTYASAVSGKTTVLPGYYYLSYLYKLPNSNNWVRVRNGLLENRKNIIVSDGSLLASFEPMTVTANPVAQNTPFQITAKVFNLAYIPSWNGSLELDLYSLDGTFYTVINIMGGLSLPAFMASNTLTFNSPGLDVPPGVYRIVLSENGGNGWKIVSANQFESSILINVSPPPIQPDPYENNDTESNAHPLNLSFTGNNAAVTTPESNMHTQQDVDHYKVALPAGYEYELTPRVHDSFFSENGQVYTNDVVWRHTVNGVPSAAFDDIMLTPNNSFTVQGGNTVHFKIWPYYLDTKGSYLFDLKATRTQTSSTQNLLSKDDFEVYPNPGNTYIKVGLTNPTLTTGILNLYNINGQLIYSKALNSNETNRIPTSDLPDGLYMLSVVTERGIGAKKVAISH